LAEETGTQGSEFPIFKSGEGAFDRAKYKQEESAMITPTGQITGKEIDEDLKKKKKSADDVIKEANKFYNDSFQKNLKSLDPAYDPSIIYYAEAYAGDSSDRTDIKRRIDDGEALDGKEIFEMSKGSAQNKIGNAQKLKTGSVTQIVENLGLKNIKEYEKYDSVKEEFDSKVKDDKLKFEPLLDKFLDILSYFNGDGGPMTTQKSAMLFTPENNAIISAFAKILEAEGFASESVLNMSKRYDDNLAKLIDKSKGGSIESMQMTKEGNVTGSTGPTGTVSETKLEEKTGSAGSTGTQASSSGPTGSAIESTKNTTGGTDTKGTTGANAASSETKLGEVKSGTGASGATGAATGATVKSEAPKLEKALDDKYNSMIKDLFGIDLGAAGGTGGTGGTGDNKEGGKSESESEKLAVKKAEDLMGPLKKEGAATGGAENKGSEKKSEDTKLETKTDKKNEKVNETLPPSTGKIETTTQNLSSVSTPVEKPKEPESTATSTNNTSTTSNTSSNTESAGSTSTESPKSETTSSEKKGDENKNEGTDNKEMLETMKNMVSLLTQLNSTMQGPLIVTPTNKKFQ